MRKEPGARRLGADFTALLELGSPMISCSLAEIQENVHVAKNFGIHRLFENIWFCEMVSLWAEKKSAEVSHKQVKCAVAVAVVVRFYKGTVSKPHYLSSPLSIQAGVNHVKLAAGRRTPPPSPRALQ